MLLLLPLVLVPFLTRVRGLWAMGQTVCSQDMSRGFHPRLRQRIALGYQNRWSGLLAVALQKAVFVARLRDEGADLPTTLLEEAPRAADLPAS